MLHCVGIYGVAEYKKLNYSTSVHRQHELENEHKYVPHITVHKRIPHMDFSLPRYSIRFSLSDNGMFYFDLVLLFVYSEVMRRLKHRNIIKYCGTYMVMERMARNLKEHFEWFVPRTATMKDWAPYLNQLFQGLHSSSKYCIYQYLLTCVTFTVAQLFS